MSSLHKAPRFQCIGSALWDIIAQAGAAMKPGHDLAGRISRRPGGVALNIAFELARQGAEVALRSTLGQDADGQALVTEIAARQIDCSRVQMTAFPTDAYLAIEQPDGQVFGAIADCASLERSSADVLSGLADDTGFDALVLDGNLSATALQHFCEPGTAPDTLTALVPASPGKARRLAPLLAAHPFTLYVNRFEAELICDTRFATAAEAAMGLLNLGCGRAIVTDGPAPAALATFDGFQLTKAPPPVRAHSTTGAGDVFLASHLMALARQTPENEAFELALATAAKFVSKPKP